MKSGNRLREPKDDPGSSAEGLQHTPRHGFRGERATTASRGVPAGLTIAISREAGSRGNTIGIRVGQKLGWPVYNQEFLEFMAQAPAPSEADSPEAERWVASQLEGFQRDRFLSHDPSVLALARVVYRLGAEGEAVLVGRGAGVFLPAETTLHVRIVAPLDDRIAYMSQWLRLPEPEAAEQVRQRDARRTDYLTRHFRLPGNESTPYDLILNSGRLGEELCADLISAAARGKQALLEGVGP